MTTLEAARTMDEELSELIALHVAERHRRAERLQFAETGEVGPIDEDREAACETRRLLEMAKPGLDGDEEAALDRLRIALEREGALAHR